MLMMSAAVVPESVDLNIIPHVPPQLLMSWVVWIVVIVFSVAVARKLTLVPGRAQLILESAVGYVQNIADELIGHDAKHYYPLLVGLFIFILASNIIGLIPPLVAPTSSPNTTFGFALMVFVFYHFEGLRKQKLAYFKQFLGPKLPWYMFPIKLLLILTEVITIFVKPFSLGLRLFCNIFSKELFLQILALLIIQFLLSPQAMQKVLTLAPLLLRPAIVLLGVIVGFIQAFVFTVLSISYIAGAVHAAEH